MKLKQPGSIITKPKVAFCTLCFGTFIAALLGNPEGVRANSSYDFPSNPTSACHQGVYSEDKYCYYDSPDYANLLLVKAQLEDKDLLNHRNTLLNALDLKIAKANGFPSGHLFELTTGDGDGVFNSVADDVFEFLGEVIIPALQRSHAAQISSGNQMNKLFYQGLTDLDKERTKDLTVASWHLELPELQSLGITPDNFHDTPAPSSFQAFLLEDLESYSVRSWATGWGYNQYNKAKIKTTGNTVGRIELSTFYDLTFTLRGKHYGGLMISGVDNALNFTAEDDTHGEFSFTAAQDDEGATVITLVRHTGSLQVDAAGVTLTATQKTDGDFTIKARGDATVTLAEHDGLLTIGYDENPEVEDAILSITRRSVGDFTITAEEEARVTLDEHRGLLTVTGEENVVVEIRRHTGSLNITGGSATLNVAEATAGTLTIRSGGNTSVSIPEHTGALTIASQGICTSLNVFWRVDSNGGPISLDCRGEQADNNEIKVTLAASHRGDIQISGYNEHNVILLEKWLGDLKFLSADSDQKASVNLKLGEEAFWGEEVGSGDNPPSGGRISGSGNLNIILQQEEAKLTWYLRGIEEGIILPDPNVAIKLTSTYNPTVTATEPLLLVYLPLYREFSSLRIDDYLTAKLVATTTEDPGSKLKLKERIDDQTGALALGTGSMLTIDKNVHLEVNGLNLAPDATIRWSTDDLAKLKAITIIDTFEVTLPSLDVLQVQPSSSASGRGITVPLLANFDGLITIEDEFTGERNGDQYYYFTVAAENGEGDAVEEKYYLRLQPQTNTKYYLSRDRKRVMYLQGNWFVSLLHDSGTPKLVWHGPITHRSQAPSVFLELMNREDSGYGAHLTSEWHETPTTDLVYATPEELSAMSGNGTLSKLVNRFYLPRAEDLMDSRDPTGKSPPPDFTSLFKLNVDDLEDDYLVRSAEEGEINLLGSEDNPFSPFHNQSDDMLGRLGLWFVGTDPEGVTKSLSYFSADINVDLKEELEAKGVDLDIEKLNFYFAKSFGDIAINNISDHDLVVSLKSHSGSVTLRSAGEIVLDMRADNSQGELYLTVNPVNSVGYTGTRIKIREHEGDVTFASTSPTGNVNAQITIQSSLKGVLHLTAADSLSGGSGSDSVPVRFSVINLNNNVARADFPESGQEKVWSISGHNFLDLSEGISLSTLELSGISFQVNRSDTPTVLAGMDGLKLSSFTTFVLQPGDRLTSEVWSPAFHFGTERQPVTLDSRNFRGIKIPNWLQVTFYVKDDVNLCQPQDEEGCSGGRVTDYEVKVLFEVDDTNRKPRLILYFPEGEFEENKVRFVDESLFQTAADGDGDEDRKQPGDYLFNYIRVKLGDEVSNLPDNAEITLIKIRNGVAATQITLREDEERGRTCDPEGAYCLFYDRDDSLKESYIKAMIQGTSEGTPEGRTAQSFGADSTYFDDPVWALQHLAIGLPGKEGEESQQFASLTGLSRSQQGTGKYLENERILLKGIYDTVTEAVSRTRPGPEEELYESYELLATKFNSFVFPNIAVIAATNAIDEITLYAISNTTDIHLGEKKGVDLLGDVKQGSQIILRPWARLSYLYLMKSPKLKGLDRLFKNDTPWDLSGHAFAADLGMGMMLTDNMMVGASYVLSYADAAYVPAEGFKERLAFMDGMQRSHIISHNLLLHFEGSIQYINWDFHIGGAIDTYYGKRVIKYEKSNANNSLTIPRGFGWSGSTVNLEHDLATPDIVTSANLGYRVHIIFNAVTYVPLTRNWLLDIGISSHGSNTWVPEIMEGEQYDINDETAVKKNILAQVISKQLRNQVAVSGRFGFSFRLDYEDKFSFRINLPSLEIGYLFRGSIDNMRYDLIGANKAIKPSSYNLMMPQSHEKLFFGTKVAFVFQRNNFQAGLNYRMRWYNSLITHALNLSFSVGF